MAELEQYSRGECVELIGRPEDTHGEKLENFVAQVFEIAGMLTNATSTSFIG